MIIVSLEYNPVKHQHLIDGGVMYKACLVLLVGITTVLSVAGCGTFGMNMEVKKLYEQGRNHPSVAGYLNNISEVYMARGDHQKAEATNREALEINKRTIRRPQSIVLGRVRLYGKTVNFSDF